MRKTILIATAAAFAASAAFAQGPGKGAGWSFNKDNTGGWSMMGREERAEHRNRMMSMKTYEECVAYLEEHRKRMEARAQERGRPGPGNAAHNMCDRMKQAGRLS